MKVINKAWDWSIVKDKFWTEPSEDSYYLLHRWKGKGFKKFLDLGCGKGRHALLFAKHDYIVSAVDLSDYAINELKLLSKEVGVPLNCTVSDMVKLPYLDDEFDCLLAYHVISHSDTEGVSKTINEIKRIVKNDGEIFLTFGSVETLKLLSEDIHYIEPNVIIKEDGAEKGIPHFYTDETTIKELLSDFEIISTRLIRNIDLEGLKEFGSHYFVHAKVKK